MCLRYVWKADWVLLVLVQYASLATQIGTAARAEAPIRALKAISPNITKKRVPRLEPVPR